MATKKTTTKPKAKTTKSATVTKKIVTKTVAAKVTVAKKSTSKSLLSKFTFRQLNLVSVVVYLVLAVLAVLLMNSSSYELTVSYLTQDKLSGGALAPAYRHLMDVQYRVFVVIFMVLAASFPLLLETKFKNSYQKLFKSNTISWGWVEKGILQGVFTILVAYLLGFQDISTIKLFALVVFAANMFGWIAERKYAAGVKTAKNVAWVGTGLVVLVLLMLAGSLLFTHIYGMIRAAWYDYAIFGALAFALLVTRLKQHKYLAGRTGGNFEHVAKTYAAVGYVSYVAAAVILIVGLAK